jgi:hypothetical protein
MGEAVLLLSGHRTCRTPGRHRDGFRSRARRLRSRLAPILPTLTDADFDKWRCQRDFTTWKYAMWDAHMNMPTQMPNGRSRCFCGASIDIQSAGAHIRSAHSPAPGRQPFPTARAIATVGQSVDDLAGRANAAALPYHPRGDGSRAERYSGQHPESEGYARVSRSTSKWNHGRHGDRGIYSNSTPSFVCALKKGGQSWIWCSRF